MAVRRKRVDTTTMAFMQKGLTTCRSIETPAVKQKAVDTKGVIHLQLWGHVEGNEHLIHSSATLAGMQTAIDSMCDSYICKCVCIHAKKGGHHVSVIHLQL